MKKSKMNDMTWYYHQKDIIRPIGMILLPLGLVMMWLGWSYISYILAIVFILSGLVMFFLGTSKLVTDNDMQELMDKALRDYDKSVTDMNGYERIVLKQPAPIEMASYQFGDKAKYFRRGKNSTPVSDVYTRTRLFYTKDALMIVSRTLSITELSVSDGTGITDVSETIGFSGIEKAYLDEHATTVTVSNTGKPMTVKWCELVIMGHDEELMRIPTKNDMDASGLVDDLNRRAKG